MFVRVERRQGIRPRAPVRLIFTLVESSRNDGHVRTRKLAYLGVIHADALRYVECRRRVWVSAEKALASLKLDQGTADAVRAQLERHVPRAAD